MGNGPYKQKPWPSNEGALNQLPVEIVDSLQMYNKEIKIMDKSMRTEEDYTATQKKLYEYMDWRKDVAKRGIHIPDSSKKKGEYTLPPWATIKKQRGL